MNSKSARSAPPFLTAILVSSMLLVISIAAPAPVHSSVGPIDALILSLMQTEGRANVFIKLADDADLSASARISDRVARLNYVHDRLTAQAESSQKEVRAFLDSRGARYVSFWINNSIYVYDADADLVNALAGRSDVAYLRGDHQVPLHEPVVEALNAVSPATIEWGVDLIQAPDVWATGNTGQGIVVANVDTGVRWTHDAIDGQYRGSDGNHDYDWWDPDLVNAVPTDGNGHGTHTMGTMVGDDGGANQIGVAPGAQWIAAQGCDTTSCSDFDLTSSAQWIACPTQVNGSNPDCSQAPHVVNNSWGGFGGDSWYATYVGSWHAAGIIPVFSAGNSGPTCQSMGSPGDYSTQSPADSVPGVFGVGATDINDTLASFSSRGRGAFTDRTKPNWVAPGSNVRSSYNSSDTSYANLSGTSMAAPHTTGTVALMLVANPAADYNALFTAITTTADTDTLDTPANPTRCNRRRWNSFPSYHYGYGRINALDAVNAVFALP